MSGEIGFKRIWDGYEKTGEDRDTGMSIGIGPTRSKPVPFFKSTGMVISA